MPDDKVHHVTLSLRRGFEFIASFDDLPAGHAIILDETPPLGEGAGPNPASLLAAAVAQCLASSLLFCLRKTRASVHALRATAKAHIKRNDAGRLRIHSIDVDLWPTISGQDLGRLKRCEDLFEDFCTVTESIRESVPVNVTIHEFQGELEWTR